MLSLVRKVTLRELIWKLPRTTLIGQTLGNRLFLLNRARLIFPLLFPSTVVLKEQACVTLSLV